MANGDEESEFGEDVAPHVHGVPISCLVPNDRPAQRRAQLAARPGFHDHEATKRAGAAIQGQRALHETPTEDWKPPETLA
jgi:hypothetical protein